MPKINNLIFTVTETHSILSPARIKAGEEFWNSIIDPVLEAHKEEITLWQKDAKKKNRPGD